MKCIVKITSNQSLGNQEPNRGVIMYQRNLIEKVTIYNKLKSYKGIDFSHEEQRRRI